MSTTTPREDSEPLFFYADQEVALYDELASLTDPSYGQLHSSLTSQVFAWIDGRKGEPVTADNILILDVGCGTGMEGIRLLQGQAAIHLIGLDISNPMLDRFRLKLMSIFGDETAMGRCRLVHGDVQEDRWIEDALAGLQQAGTGATCHMILSAYALHHFDANTKAQMYNRIYQHLRPGGAFVNADLFGFDSLWLRTLVQSQLEEWIESQFDSAAATPGELSISDPSVWRRLKGQWLQHVREENRPLSALSSGTSSGDSSNGVSEQHLLVDAGFSAIECTFRVGQSAILWAFKGDETS